MPTNHRSEGRPSGREPVDLATWKKRPCVLFLGSGYAGHRTRFENLESHTRGVQSINATYRTITGWTEGGVFERIPVIGRLLAGRFRAVTQAAPFASFPRPDAIWTSAGRELAPFLWSQVGRLRRPLVLDLDWTLAQQEELAQVYFGRPGKMGWRLALAKRIEQALWKNVTLFSPWSQWAADSLRRGGIESSRIVVNPPGVDLELYKPQARRRSKKGPLRLLFIGGDLRRKGGDTLLRVLQERFSDNCELDIVTREDVDAGGPVRVHRAEPNSTTITDLLGAADVFVMPTRAECFGIATVEAMASGLPTIIGDVGAAREIVSHRETGWLVEPTEEGFGAALELALSGRDDLADMGRRARKVAEAKFDGGRNDARVVETILTAIDMSSSGSAQPLREGARRAS